MIKIVIISKIATICVTYKHAISWAFHILLWSTIQITLARRACKDAVLSSGFLEIVLIDDLIIQKC